jgi:GNAT superfamily N-acetyltransferase
MVEVELLLPAAADDPVLVAELAVLVNRAYEVAEEGVWHGGVARTTDAEVSEAILGGEVVLARDTGRIVGSIRTRLLDEKTGWFGVLAVDGAEGGQGIGGKLVADAESRAASAGASTMQLELLVPVQAHPHSDRLAAWYGRLGYRDTGRLELADVEPSAVPFLALPCNVAVMQKRLTQPVG